MTFLIYNSCITYKLSTMKKKYDSVTKPGTENKISVAETIKNQTTTPDQLPGNSENPRFYGLLPIIWVSVGIILFMIFVKFIMDWLAKS